MKKIATLQKKAMKCTRFRRHKMKWILDEKWGRGICSKCGMDVDLNTNPAPNQIDIGGEALALNCK